MKDFFAIGRKSIIQSIGKRAVRKREVKYGYGNPGKK